MAAPIFARIFLLCPLISSWAAIRYDERQTGDTNVRVDIEDLAVLILLDGDLAYSDDYTYDYSDLTVKPETQQSTTSPSFPLPSEVASLWGSNATHSPNNSNATVDNSTTTIASNDTSSNVTTSTSNGTTVQNGIPGNLTKGPSSEAPPGALPLNTQNMQIPVVVITDGSRKEYIPSSSIREKHRSDEKRKCLPGFFLDERNRCKKKNLKGSLHKERPPLPHGLHYAQRPNVTSSATA